MGTLGKKARRRQRAQESLERGDSHSDQGKDSNVDSEIDMEGDHEVLFPPKKSDNISQLIHFHNWYIPVLINYISTVKIFL